MTAQGLQTEASLQQRFEAKSQEASKLEELESLFETGCDFDYL